MPKPLGTFIDFTEAFDCDAKLLDAYIGYSAELLRLSLLAITGITTVCVTLRPQLKTSFHDLLWSFSLALIALFCSSASALAHRFVATDSMAFHLESLRLYARAISDDPDPCDVAEAKKQKNGRDLRLSASKRLLWISALTLFIGAILAVRELATW